MISTECGIPDDWNTFPWLAMPATLRRCRGARLPTEPPTNTPAELRDRKPQTCEGQTSHAHPQTGRGTNQRGRKGARTKRRRRPNRKPVCVCRLRNPPERSTQATAPSRLVSMPLETAPKAPSHRKTTRGAIPPIGATRPAASRLANFGPKATNQRCPPKSTRDQSTRGDFDTHTHTQSHGHAICWPTRDGGTIALEGRTPTILTESNVFRNDSGPAQRKDDMKL